MRFSDRTTGFSDEHIDAIWCRARETWKSGRLQAAEDLCRQILQFNPRHADAWHLSGIIAYQGGDYSEACHRIDKAVRNSTPRADLCNNLGLALLGLSQPKAAIQQFQTAVQISPDYVDAYLNLGKALEELHQGDNAAKAYGKALQLSPDFPEAHFNLAGVLSSKGRLPHAIRHYRKALQLRPHYDRAWNNFGNVLREVGRLDEAIGAFQRALELTPDYLPALNNLANALRAKGLFSEAVDLFTQAVRVSPESAESHCNLGNALKDGGHFEAALQSYRQAVRIRPDFAEAHFNASIIHLLTGDYEKGWPAYEWRLKRETVKNLWEQRLRLPRWDGRPFVGKRLLVFDEQGFGDTLQFLRFLPLVKARGGTVIFETRKALVTLAENCAELDEVAERPSLAQPAQEADLYIPLMSLAGLMGIRVETILANIPYIKAPAHKSEYWRARLAAGGFKIGLVWSGSRVDPNRSCTLEYFARLNQIPGINLYGLQKAVAAQSGDSSQTLSTILKANLGTEFEDFADTAGAIDNLDLIVSVDTAVAHLAGAMGKPTWLLLPYIADWRWLLDREDSPWYPTMRLFRQTAPGDWNTVIEQLADELRKHIFTGMQPAAASSRWAVAELELFDGNRHYDQGKLDSALLCYDRTIRIKPDYAEAWFNSARILQDLGRVDQALLRYRRAVTINPSLFQAHYNMGLMHHANGQIAQALECYRRALDVNPAFPAAWNNLGAAHQTQGQLDEAIDRFRQAVEIDPNYVDACHNLGRVFFQKGNYEEARNWFRKTLRIDANHIDARHNLGLCCQELGLFDDAQQCYQEVIARKPDYLNAYYNMGNLFSKQGKLDETIRWYRKALRWTPNNVAAVHNVGKLLHQLGRLDEAESFYLRAISLEPGYADAHFDRSIIFLTKGQWTRGWEEYEWRFKKADWKNAYPYRFTTSPRWDGSKFEGKRLLVHCEQGLGDTLQFARYLPMVKARGGTVIFETAPPLTCLFHQFGGIDQLIELSPQAKTEVPFDAYVPLLSLPGIFGTTLDTIPAGVPYVFADSEKTESWGRRIANECLKVGLVWAGGKLHAKDACRSCGLQVLLPVLQVPGVRFYGLQKGQPAQEVKTIPKQMAVINYGAQLNDFADTAALLANLDLVISVDTAVAHLAGAMAKPVWVLLPYPADWRWLLQREDSPWYPSMRLFRQHEAHDWESVIMRVARALKEFVANHELPIAPLCNNRHADQGKDGCCDPEPI